MTNETNPPKLFISYSWSSPEHEEWVLKFAEELVSQGIDVKLDKWHLKPGYDANAFMEQMVTDETVTKVLLICDKKYAEKSNARKGGAGTEAQIITPEIYSKKEQDKFAAVVTEVGEDGQPYLPVYYKGRIFFDLSSAERYALQFEQLVRWVWNKPLHVPPPLGKAPSFVTEEGPQKIPTAVTFRRALEAIKNARPAAVPATVEYLDTIVAGLESFRVAATHKTIDTFDDVIVKSVEDFSPYRNELEELFLAVAAYQPSDEMVEALHRFFERLMPFYFVPENVSSSFVIDCDNLKFIAHELFLLCVGAFVKYERFSQAAYFMETEYYFPDRFTNTTMKKYGFFREYPRAFEMRTQRLKLRRVSLLADFLKQRASIGGLDFKYIMTADFALYLRSHINPEADWSEFWFPDTLVYLPRHGTLEAFARAKSAKYFERIRPMLGVKNKADLGALVERLTANPQGLPRYDYETLNVKGVLNLDAIATTP